MASKVYEFEGAKRTLVEIQKMVPIYGIKALRGYFAQEPTPKTRQDLSIIEHQRKLNSRAASRKNAQLYKNTNHKFFKLKGQNE